MISFSLSEDQQMIVNMVKQFATDELRQAYRVFDESGQIPAHIIDPAGEMGFISSSIPEEYGGLGEQHSSLTGSLIAEELAWGDLSMAMHILCPALAVFPILEMGTGAQKKKYLPSFCNHKYQPATAALIEPRYDFDPYSLAATARLDGSDYVLNGDKCYVPLAADADLLLVYADENGGTQGFIVEKGAEGLKIGEREKNMGIKALATYELTLKDCRVPAENRLGGQQGADFNRIIDYSRVALSAMAVGVARAAFPPLSTNIIPIHG